MKLGIISDIHARYLAMENRIDEHFFDDVILGKLTQVMDIFQDRGCKAVLQGGDLWDSPNPTRFVISKVLRLLRQYDMMMYTVLGQHDMIMRNFDNVDRTGTYVLDSAGVATIVGLDGKPKDLGDDTFAHGLSFEQDFATPSPIPGCFNVLIAHASVGNKELYPGQILPSAREFVRKHPGYDLIVVGDYHYTCEDTYKGCTLLNTGCMIRKTVLQEDLEHEPCVFVYDTETRTYEKIMLKIRPWQEVFHIPDKIKHDDSKLQAFLEAIKGDKKVAVKFTAKLQKYYEETEVSACAKKLVASYMEKAGMSEKELQEVS